MINLNTNSELVNLPPIDEEVKIPPPPPMLIQTAVPLTCKAIKVTEKEKLRKIIRDVDGVVAPFKLSNSSPEFVENDLFFGKWASSYLPGARFKDSACFAKFNDSFEAWKGSYLKIIQIATSIDSLTDKEIADTGLVSQLKAEKEQSQYLFQQFITGFASTLEGRDVATLKEASQIVTTHAEQSAVELTDEAGKFGGVHSDYKMLIINAKVKEGSAWLNHLILRYKPEIKPGDTIEIPLLDAWLKKEAKEEIPSREVLGALDRIGTSLEDFCKDLLKKDKTLQYPVNDCCSTPGMQELWDKFDPNVWFKEVQENFSKTDGWKKSADPKKITELKEQAFLLYAFWPDAPRVIRNLTEDIANYFFTNELLAKYHA